MLEEHIYYARNDIQKPFNMGIPKYAECMCNIIEMYKLIRYPISKNGDCQEYNWDTRDTPYKNGITRK